MGLAVWQPKVGPGADLQHVRYAERGERVCEPAFALARGTALDTGTYLDRLTRVERASRSKLSTALLPASLPRNLDSDAADIGGAPSRRCHSKAGMVLASVEVARPTTATILFKTFGQHQLPNRKSER